MHTLLYARLFIYTTPPPYIIPSETLWLNLCLRLPQGRQTDTEGVCPTLVESNLIGEPLFPRIDVIDIEKYTAYLLN